jgi:hypothetical protein
LGAVVDPDLREDSLHVRLDRLDGHAQRTCDLTVREAARDKDEDLAFARSQWRKRASSD